MRRNKVDWLNKIYYVTGWSLLVTFVGWLDISYVFYRENICVSIKDIIIILFGVLLQLLAGIMFAYVGRRRLDTSELIKKWTKGKIACLKEFDDAFSTEEKWPQEEIASLLLTRETQEKIESDKSEYTKALKDEIEKIVTNRKIEVKRMITEREMEMSWHDVSKLLYKVGRLCKERSRFDLAKKIESQYSIVRQILKLELLTGFVNMASSMLFFFIGFLAINRFSAWLFGERVGWDWVWPVGLVVGGVFGASLIHIWLQFLSRWFTEKSLTDLDDIIVGIASGPLAVGTLVVAIYWSLIKLPLYFKNYITAVWSILTRDMILRITFIVITTWFAIFIFDRIVIYLLRRWAERTEQKYDDMFVRIFQVFGEFLIVAVAIGIILINFQPQIAVATGGTIDNVLLPYSLIVSVFSAILGFASREAIENFFGGVLLQIDKPFKKGERLVLETGEICDVCEIGMRSTTLYNVIENTEISIPNSIMVAQKITNVSRPDWQLRIQVRLAIPHDGYILSRAEEILLDVAYLECEVDQLRVTMDEISPELEMRNRKPMKEEIRSLVQLHPQIMNTEISQIIGGVKFNNQPVFGLENVRKIEANNEWEINKRLDRITTLRKQYTDQLEENKKVFLHLRGSLSQQLPTEINEVRLEKIINEIVHRVILETKISNRPETINETQKLKLLEEVIKELSKREGISEMPKGQEECGTLEEAILCFSKQIAKEYGKQPPRSPLKSCEVIISYFKEKENIRLGILRQIINEVAWVADGIFTIADIHRKARRDMDALISELGKEPVVHSRFVVSDEGRGYVEIDFNVYATHLERRFEVIAKVNREIQRRFSMAGIKMWDLGSGQKGL